MNKKKVLIFGSGLTSLIMKNILKFDDNFQLYEVLHKKEYSKNLVHPHVFPPLFLNFFSNYVYKINIFKRLFREDLIYSLKKKLEASTIQKLIFEDYNFKFNKNQIDLSHKYRNDVSKYDFFLDCSGGIDLIQKKLEKNINIISYPKSTILVSIFAKVNFNIIKSKIYENNTFYLKKFNLTVLAQKNNTYSFTFVSDQKIDKQYCTRFLSKLLSKEMTYELKKSMKWIHLKSQFINTHNDMKSYIPIGDAFMRTDPQYGLGVTFGLLQCIYISQNLSKLNFNEYFEKFKFFFNKIEEKKIRINKKKKINVLFRFIPFYSNIKQFYYFKKQKKQFK